MTHFVWNDVLRIQVGEMSRSDSLHFTQSAERIDLIPDATLLHQELEFLFISCAPVSFVFNNEPLEDGTHELILTEGEPPLVLKLPITRECYNNLPISLTAKWHELALKENVFMSDFFLAALKRLEKITSALASEDAPS